jgi:hypothetical protein
MSPCLSNPAAWDITSGYKTDSTTGAVIQAALTAAANCNQCPIIEACRQSTLTTPPIHRCVQAGLIWEPTGNYGATPYTPAQWAKKHRLSPVVAALPENAPHCVECDARFRHRKGRVYCSRLCNDRARNRRVASERQAQRVAQVTDLAGQGWQSWRIAGHLAMGVRTVKRYRALAATQANQGVAA